MDNEPDHTEHDVVTTGSDHVPVDHSEQLPSIQDDGGYLVQPRDLAFVGVTVDALRLMLERHKPLGFASVELWQECCAELSVALHASGIEDADVRLKGSATTFCSRNPDKLFPQSDEDCAGRLASKIEDVPTSLVDKVRRRWHESPFAASEILPTKNFWDLAYTLGFDTDRSDYDFQICSDVIMQKVAMAYPDGTDDDGRSIYSVHGGGLKAWAIRPLFQALFDWAARWEAMLDRQVNIAVFSSAGPAAEISRFSEQDWVIIA